MLTDMPPNSGSNGSHVGDFLKFPRKLGSFGPFRPFDSHWAWHTSTHITTFFFFLVNISICAFSTLLNGNQSTLAENKHSIAWSHPPEFQAITRPTRVYKDLGLRRLPKKLVAAWQAPGRVEKDSLAGSQQEMRECPT